MSAQLIANNRDNAEVYSGAAACKQKSAELLSVINFPNGLLPLNDRAIGRTVSYETEVAAFVEKRRMRRFTGVKSKELLIWVTISDIFIDDRDKAKITFENPTGISRFFPVSAFETD